jgi:choline dehydrogenase-like flavoprotein
MFTIVFYTNLFRPGHVVTLRAEPNWNTDVPGLFYQDAWWFSLPATGGAFAFKLYLNDNYWQSGDNIHVQLHDGGQYALHDDNVAFDGYMQPDLGLPALEHGRLAQLYFVPDLQQDSAYDVIVIGSGIGGGIIAERLADKGRKVLVLEAGSLLFPTHVGNLPRRHALSGGIDKSVWNLFYDLQCKLYKQSAHSLFRGGFGINFGGRSVYWGGYIPRMAPFEFHEWPTEIRNYLSSGGYDAAEILLRKSTLRTPYQLNLEERLGQRFGSHIVAQLPLSVGQTDVPKQSVPTGIFSTADLLMESRLTSGPLGSNNLVINLNHPVTHIQQQPDASWRVFAYDRFGKIERPYRARSVVLAAGSVHSPAIVQRSGLNNPSGLVGKGFTDHPIFFAHFTIPQSSPIYSAGEAAKIMMHHNAAAYDSHRYVTFVDVGSDLSLSRFVDPELFAAHLAARGNRMLAEVVFQFSSPLIDANYVQTGAGALDQVVIELGEGAITVSERNEIDILTDDIVDELDGMPVPGESLTLMRAPSGGVAHEAGTLRIGPAGVVNANLGYRGQDNLYVCDLSVFPSSPAANPTLTLAALAMRLADFMGTR